MNNYHRFLNIENCVPNVDFSQWDTDSVTEWSKFHKILTLQKLNNKNLLNLLDSLKMTSRWIEVFCTPPNGKGVIHSDSPIGEDWAKLIFQYGAKGSKMRWWSSEKIHVVSTDPTQISKLEISNVDKYIGGDRSGGHYHGQIQVAQEVESKLEYEIEIGKCSMINVGPLHSSYNPTKEKRLVISIALFDLKTEQRILWNEALNRLKQYIIE